MTAAMDPQRRGQLLGIKLRALVGDHVGRAVEAEPVPLLGGSALVDADVAWVLVDGDASRLLGASLAWAIRHGASALNVVADVGGGTVARRAEMFDFPINVWFPQVRTLLPTVAEPLPERRSASMDNPDLIEMITNSGAVVNVEHGTIAGEVRGLEICRIVDQPTVGFFAELSNGIVPASGSNGALDRGDGVRLEVGVGAADREAFQMLHGDLPTAEALMSVVATVITHRSASARQHPLNRLGVERYLRWEAEQDPSRVGLASLRSAEPPAPRPNLKDPIPCVAAGSTADDQAVHVVFSSGVDLDAVPFVADVQRMVGTPVRLAVPTRDLVPVTREMAELLLKPIELIALD
ncbi:MAG: hypothetical protein O3B90_03435 [Actinomycetota bacterium]|jgi:hypothetical protein|nr:hypothetical protein [Actinomycetota bacterium]